MFQGVNKSIYCRRIKLLLSTLIFIIFFLNSTSFAVNFSAKSNKRIRGYSPISGIDFSGKTLPDNTTVIILKFNGKRIIAQINDKERRIYIKGSFISRRKPAFITDGDSDILKGFLYEILEENIAGHKLGDKFLRLLNLLYSWPPNLPLEVSILDDKVSLSQIAIDVYEEQNLPAPESDLTPFATSACQIPLPLGLSESICSEINSLHTGNYMSLGHLIKWIIPPVLGIHYPLQCTPYQEVVGPFPFESGDCFGRCGKGCIGDGFPNNDLNIFTQNCFNHDACVSVLGYLHPYCNQMFLYTINDALSGFSCD